MTNSPFYKRPGFYALLIIGLGILAIIIPTLGVNRTFCGPTADVSNLRQIGQAAVIYSQTHNDQLPNATDIWDYARLLSEGGGLEDARMWQSRKDPATAASPSTVSRVSDPAFQAIKPSIAVALGRLSTRKPPTTPIAWTRGLQPDGTWSAHSPYGTDGGYILFLGGNVAYYRNLTNDGGQLIRFDGSGKTANILEALPPGIRIGEYTPTPEDKIAWAESVRWQKKIDVLKSLVPLLLFLALLWLPLVIISIVRLRRKHPGAFTVLLWPLLILFLILVFKSCG